MPWGAPVAVNEEPDARKACRSDVRGAFSGGVQTSVEAKLRGP